LVAVHRPRISPATRVSIRFASYVKAWEEHRAQLTHLDQRIYQRIRGAFDQLNTLGLRAERGDDLREEVFDAIWDAGQSCERARRVLYPSTLTATDRLVGTLRAARQRRRERRGWREVERRWLALHG
jgi:hypothetical protein